MDKMEAKNVMLAATILLLIKVPATCVSYKIGVGRADCTGPVAEVVLMGYAKSSQKGCGLHTRQFSRAFIFDDGIKRIAFVSVDVGMMGHEVRRAVLERLTRLYNDTYTERNVILSGTHTHSAPGGFLIDFMYDIPSMGFNKETFAALVDGITRSVVKAHNNMVEGQIFLASGELSGASINRSPASYELNPKEERERYKDNVDKEMVLLRLVRSSDKTIIGSITWFAVHPTSMNFSNCLVTSDNVGLASILLEKSRNKNHLIGQGPFVGAFASTNLGDVSPNTKGAKCTNTGEDCNYYTSTCEGEAKFCVASGPGHDMFESTRIIAEKLNDKAMELIVSPNARKITGSIDFIHQYVDMPTQRANITLANGTIQEVRGCLPAMGYSFGAGTTDGVGEFGFTQGSRTGNPMWNGLRDVIFPPTEDEIECHAPKPILINSGRLSVPYEWQPRIVSVQIMKLGEVFLIAVPGEFTTMSGRRLREAVTDTVIRSGGSSHSKSVITGLSNFYSSYITTPEEYQLQRYEGASTIYGPHTLTLYLNIYRKLAEKLIKGEKCEPGPKPPYLLPKAVSLAPGVMFDTSGLLKSFGDCIREPQATVQRGMTVNATFISGHPRNNPMHGKSFLTIEQLDQHNRWSVIATDANWETKFIWRRTANLVGGSVATVLWTIPLDTTPGFYRICHIGHAKGIIKGIFAYRGCSRKFELLH